MVIGNFYIRCMSRSPFEADSPLLVDADAVLALPVATEGFQLVRYRNRKILQTFCSVELLQFHQRPLLDVGWQFSCVLALPEVFGIPVLERPYLGVLMVTPCVSNVKRYRTPVIA